MGDDDPCIYVFVCCGEDDPSSFVSVCMAEDNSHSYVSVGIGDDVPYSCISVGVEDHYLVPPSLSVGVDLGLVSTPASDSLVSTSASD